jgi:hypothetical protein
MAPTNDFTPAQEQRLEDMIKRVVQATMQFNRPCSRTAGASGTSRASRTQGAPGLTVTGAAANSWRPDKLGFFDPDLQDDDVVGRGDIVYLGNHPYYRNVGIKDIARAPR